MLQISKLCQEIRTIEIDNTNTLTRAHTNRSENENEQQHSKNNQQTDDRQMNKPAIQTLEPISKIRIQPK